MSHSLADLLTGIEPPRHDTGCKRLLRWPADTRTTAVFDGPGDCYRYALTQTWDPARPLAMFALMNPSGASIDFGDSTLLRTGWFARRWGYGGQLIANACAWRRTDNEDLLAVPDPAGPQNLHWVCRLAAQAQLVVIGHGQLPAKLQHHADGMVAALRAAGHDLHVFGLSKAGVPVHPLARGKHRLSDETKPIRWALDAPL